MPAEETRPLLVRRELPLHRASAQGQDVPIFLGVCYSPWSWPTQRALVLLRGLIFAYYTGLAPPLVRFELRLNDGADGHTSWAIVFDFPTVSYALNWFFHLIAFLWSLMHNWSPVFAEDDRRWKARALSKLFPPEPPACSRKPLYFSLFYTAVHVFNFLNALVYWAVLVPKGHGNLPDGGGDPGNGWFEPFSILNLYGVTPLISSVEILFLNSIKRQDSISRHILVIVLLLAGYLGWGGIGKLFTGHYPFFWMNTAEVGKIGLAAYSSGFVGMGVAAFAAMYGLTALRDKLVNYGSRRGQYDLLQDSGDA